MGLRIPGLVQRNCFAAPSFQAALHTDAGAHALVIKGDARGFLCLILAIAFVVAICVDFVFFKKSFSPDDVTQILAVLAGVCALPGIVLVSGRKHIRVEADGSTQIRFTYLGIVVMTDHSRRVRSIACRSTVLRSRYESVGAKYFGVFLFYVDGGSETIMLSRDREKVLEFATRFSHRQGDWDSIEQRVDIRLF